MELNDFVVHFAEQFDETDAAVFTPELFFRKSARLSWGVAKMTMGNVKISTVIEY